MTVNSTVNLAAYKFASLTDLPRLRARLLQQCREWGLKGTILLSEEGINLFVAGPAAETDRLLAELRSVPGLADLAAKTSWTDHQPFRRMLVRVKREIIAFGVAEIDPARRPAPKLSAVELRRWLEEGRAMTLLDTRNDYEIKLGTFRNAVPIGIDQFRDFPAAARRLPAAMKDQPVVMFCTGGIRCEKAGPFLEREGFKHVFQLEGGILKYFETCGSAYFDGECFVFDQRVGLDANLRETGSAQCFRCQSPLTAAEQADPRHVPGQSCPHCHQSPGAALAIRLARRHAAIARAATPLPGRQPYDLCKPINVPAQADGGSLAQAFACVVRHLPVEFWEQECARGLILNDRQEVMPAGRVVRAGERYFHKFPGVTEPDVNAGLEILHEDEALVVLNKPAPLPMHAGGRFNRNTLQYFLNAAYHPERPCPAHRLDANTTGLVLVTRARRFAAGLQGQFARGEVEKIYLARVQGRPVRETFECAAPISAEAGKLGTRTIDIANGLPAFTGFQVRRGGGEAATLLEARPRTGRTNQIRVHLWHLGLPVCGDQVYLPGQQMGTTQTLSLTDPPLCLHAWKLKFLHPSSRAPMEFTAPPPAWAGQV